MTDLAKKQQQAKWAIGLITLVVSALVAFMYLNNGAKINPGFDVSILPPFHAFLNSCVSVLLLLALFAIKSGKQDRHKKLMLTATGFSAVFLLSYVLYHMSAESTSYGGEGLIKTVYYFILITHVVLAAVVFPFILFTLYQAWLGQFGKHRKLARITWPLWFYVAVTGVIVYFMISPYY